MTFLVDTHTHSFTKWLGPAQLVYQRLVNQYGALQVGRPVGRKIPSFYQRDLKGMQVIGIRIKALDHPGGRRCLPIILFEIETAGADVVVADGISRAANTFYQRVIAQLCFKIVYMSPCVRRVDMKSEHLLFVETKVFVVHIAELLIKNGGACDEYDGD